MIVILAAVMALELPGRRWLGRPVAPALPADETVSWGELRPSLRAGLLERQLFSHHTRHEAARIAIALEGSTARRALATMRGYGVTIARCE